ncbi:MAG: hypothetical protein JWM11_7546 [Planctomycetaceae bacterium]|nr:hypothetical protein [Planctomycetaceae bacterium]
MVLRVISCLRVGRLDYMVIGEIELILVDGSLMDERGRIDRRTARTTDIFELKRPD